MCCESRGEINHKFGHADTVSRSVIDAVGAGLSLGATGREPIV
jgi:hypothetical protein